MSARAARSTLTSRNTGSSITRRYASTGGLGAASRPSTARSIDTFNTRALRENPSPGKRCRSRRCASGPSAPASFPHRIGNDPSDRRSLQQFRPNPQRLIRRDARCGTSTGFRARYARCAGPGWPASETPGRDRPRPARCRSRRWARLPLHGEKRIDRLFESPLQQIVVSVERNVALGGNIQLGREVKAMDRVEKKQRANPLIQVVAVAAKSIELVALDQ